jgi:hypothetical protein
MVKARLHQQRFRHDVLRTYWNRGPGPGPSYLDTEEGHDWSHSTGEAAAANLVAAASALAANPIPAPPNA